MQRAEVAVANPESALQDSVVAAIPDGDEAQQDDSEATCLACHLRHGGITLGQKAAIDRQDGEDQQDLPDGDIGADPASAEQRDVQQGLG